jgi:hypothetical protein
MSNILYKVFYFWMLSGYLLVSIQVPGFKMKLIGILLTIVNGLLFWK